MPEGLNQDQTTPVEQIVQQVAGQVEDQKPEALPEDVDARALVEAKAELAREQAAAKAQEAPQVAADQAKAEPAKAEQPKEGEGEKPKHFPGMVPLDRFKRIVDERNEKDRQIAYLAGQLSVINKPAADGKKEPTPEEQIKAIQDQRLALADQVDHAKISMRQYEEAKQALQGQEDAIRAKLNAPKPEPKAEPKSPDLYTESKLAELESQHPYTKELDDPKYKAHWDFLSAEATKALIETGTIKAGQKSLSPAQDLKFKEKLAELTDVYGPIWTGKQLKPDQKAEVKEQVKPGPTKTAQARAEKLALQSEIAPDVSQLGSAGPAGPDHSDAAIETMNEEDIIKNVPKSTRDRILGRVPR